MKCFVRNDIWAHLGIQDWRTKTGSERTSQATRKAREIKDSSIENQTVPSTCDRAFREEPKSANETTKTEIEEKVVGHFGGGAEQRRI